MRSRKGRRRGPNGGRATDAEPACTAFLGLAAFAYVMLREHGTESEEPATEPDVAEPARIGRLVGVPVAKPPRECF